MFGTEFATCKLKTSTRSQFCNEHVKRKYRVGSAIARKLRIKCDQDNCTNIALYTTSYCSPHRSINTTNHNYDPAKSPDVKSILKIIKEQIMPLAMSGINFYVGRTSSVGHRTSEHIAVQKSPHTVVQSLIKVKGIETANKFEISFIFECAFHENRKIRENLLNRGVGGSGQYGRDPDALYDVYVRYDAMSSNHERCGIPDGNLSRKALTNC